MSFTPPELLLRKFFNDDPTAFEKACYGVYLRDFRAAPPECRPRPMYADTRPVCVRQVPHTNRADREYTYWHLITGDEGCPGTAPAKPDEERMERMPYARPFIEESGEQGFKVWHNVRGRNRHLCIWHDCLNVVVVLADYGNHWELKTLYRPTRKRKLEFHKEYAQSLKGWR